VNTLQNDGGQAPGHRDFKRCMKNNEKSKGKSVSPLRHPEVFKQFGTGWRTRRNTGFLIEKASRLLFDC
jgi:hypothetical protein